MENLTGTQRNEDNKLIAEFMGYKVISYKGNPTYNGNTHAKTNGELRSIWNGLDLNFTGRKVKDVIYPFDSDWNYLMPIIEKVRLNAMEDDTDEIYNSVQYDKVNNALIDLNIKDTHFAVIEFIKWYNKEIS